MKKIVLILCILIGIPAYAGIEEFKALEDFATANPTETIKIQAIRDFEISKDNIINKNSIIEGSVTVKPRKRLKRNATFTFYPSSYTYENERTEIKDNIKGKYIKTPDTKNMAKSAALKIGSKFIPGVSAGYYLVNGAVNNEEGNRAKSAVYSLYENSPLSLWKMGKDIEIKKDDNFYLYLKKYKK